MGILIIDHSASDREQLKFLLNLGGFFDLTFATTIAEAFQILKIDDLESEPPHADLILIDIFMEGINGIEVCRKIKSSPRLKDIPVIVVTKEISMENMLTAFEAGAVDYISKPLEDKIELLPRVNSALNLKREIEMRKVREKEILNMAIQHEGTRVSDRITFSAGIGSVVPDHDLDSAGLISAADKALYRAKAEGRNRYEIFEEQKEGVEMV